MQPVPAVWLQSRVFEVDQDRAQRVRRQAHGVGVGHQVRDDLQLGRDVDADGEPVARVPPRPLTAHRPGAVGGVAGHRHGVLARGALRGEQEVDGLGGRSPQRKPRPAPVPGGPEGAAARRGVQVVQYAGQLQARDALDGAIGSDGGDRNLTGEELLQREPVGHHQRVVRREVRVLRTQVGRESAGADRERSGLATGDLAVLAGQSALLGPVEPVVPVCARLGKVPGDGVAAQPLRGGAVDQRLGGVVDDPVGVVVVGERDRPAWRGQRYVRTAGAAVRAVVLGPPVVQRDLVVVAARRYLERPAEDSGLAVDGLQVRGGTLRLPVARTAELLLQGADERHRLRHRRVIGRRRRGRQHRNEHCEPRQRCPHGVPAQARARSPRENGAHLVLPPVGRRERPPCSSFERW